jgi:hypothetical protein
MAACLADLDRAADQIGRSRTLAVDEPQSLSVIGTPGR